MSGSGGRRNEDRSGRGERRNEDRSSSGGRRDENRSGGILSEGVGNGLCRIQSRRCYEGFNRMGGGRNRGRGSGRDGGAVHGENRGGRYG